MTLEQPDVVPLAQPWWRPSYQLRRDFEATWRGVDGRVLRMVVPAGFRSDGSSEWLLFVLGLFPAVLLWFFGIAADGPHRAAWVVHDWLYRYRGAVPYQVQARNAWVGGTIPLSREEADAAFCTLALQGGMLPWRTFPRWAVLRALGWVSWRRDRDSY